MNVAIGEWLHHNKMSNVNTLLDKPLVEFSPFFSPNISKTLKGTVMHNKDFGCIK